jgi:RimJ/RimL family protein N-acetyltransferase
LKLETERLVLRRWRPEDVPAYAAIMADPAVADWLSGPLSHEESEDQVRNMEAQFESLGYGRFAVELKGAGALVGAVGLNPLGTDYDPTPVGGSIEIGWRLGQPFWGRGLANEAARAVLADGFERLGVAEIVAFTAASNLRSRAVMARLGFARQDWRDFDHPKLAMDHPLRPHVVYAVSKD